MSERPTYSVLLQTLCERVDLSRFPQLSSGDLLGGDLSLSALYYPPGMTGALPPKADSSCEGPRVLLTAPPGGGKTTFCRHLVSALTMQTETAEREPVHAFLCGMRPFYLACGLYPTLPEGARAGDGDTLLRTLCLRTLGTVCADADGAGVLPAEAFRAYLSDRERPPLLILDGWDEIVSENDRSDFASVLDECLNRYPAAGLLITLRSADPVPPLRHSLSRVQIAELDDVGVEDFCRRWAETLFGAAEEVETYRLLARRLLNAADPALRTMSRRPLELSLLLTAVRSEGVLPSDKNALYGIIADLYIRRGMTRGALRLKHAETKLLLSYLAFSFTRDDRLTAPYPEVCRRLGEARETLAGKLSKETAAMAPEDLLTGLLQSGLFFAFSERDERHCAFTDGEGHSHRQMQEYLTAFAVKTGCADRLCNGMPPEDYFRNHAHGPLWREVILFYVLDKDNEWEKREITSGLLENTSAPAGSVRREAALTLLSFLQNDAALTEDEQRKIYSAVLRGRLPVSVTDALWTLFTTRHTRFDEDGETLFPENDPDYADAAALRRLLDAAPADPASRLGCAFRSLASGTREERQSGLVMLDLLARSQYGGGLLFPPLRGYTRLDGKRRECLARVLHAELETEDGKLTAAYCLQSSVLAGFADFSDLIGENELEMIRDRYANEPGADAADAVILSAAPSVIRFADGETHRNVISRYGDGSDETAEHVLSGMHRAERILSRREQLPLRDDTEEGLPTLPLLGTVRDTPSFCRRLYTRPGLVLYDLALSDDDDISLLLFPTEDMTPAAVTALYNDIQDTLIERNNLAYRLRRKKLKSAELISGSLRVRLTPARLLEEGIAAGDAYSLINGALTAAGMAGNDAGSPDAGLAFLKEHAAVCPASPASLWERAARWWYTLAVEQHEAEGAVVLDWLTSLKIIDPPKLWNQDELKKLKEAHPGK